MWWHATSFLTIHLRLVAVFVFSNFYNFSWNIFHIHQKQLYMLQNSLSCKILLVIISARVFPIQKSLCKIASLSKIRWESLEIFSSTLWPFSAISLFFFYIIVFNLILVFISIYWSIFLPIRTFSYFSIFASGAFVKKPVITFSEYGWGGGEQCHKKVYKQEDLQQIPFENITLRLLLSTQPAFFFHSSEPVHSSWRSTVAANYPTVIARMLRSIVWT